MNTNGNIPEVNSLSCFSVEQAEKDFAAGIYRYFTCGQMNPYLDEFCCYLREHYGVEICWTGKINRGEDSVADDYSDRMFELLKGKFGKDIFEEAEYEIGVCFARYGWWSRRVNFLRMRFFADGCSSAIWDRNGYPCWVEDITGKTEKLDERIMEWADRYDTEIEDVLTGIGPCITASTEVREKFNQDGLILAKEVRKLLPSSAKLIYIAVGEALTGGEAIEVCAEPE